LDDAHTSKEAAMKGFALIAALTVAATALAATAADAQTRKSKRYYGGDTYYQQNWNSGWNQPYVHGRRDPSSYDGYRTGNPRTCGSDFFRYDDRGVPMGPYCN
jgi:hypothetical protein